MIIKATPSCHCGLCPELWMKILTIAGPFAAQWSVQGSMHLSKDNLTDLKKTGRLWRSLCNGGSSPSLTFCCLALGQLTRSTSSGNSVPTETSGSRKGQFTSIHVNAGQTHAPGSPLLRLSSTHTVFGYLLGEGCQEGLMTLKPGYRKVNFEKTPHIQQSNWGSYILPIATLAASQSHQGKSTY